MHTHTHIRRTGNACKKNHAERKVVRRLDGSYPQSAQFESVLNGVNYTHYGELEPSVRSKTRVEDLRYLE